VVALSFHLCSPQQRQAQLFTGQHGLRPSVAIPKDGALAEQGLSHDAQPRVACIELPIDVEKMVSRCRGAVVVLHFHLSSGGGSIADAEWLLEEEEGAPLLRLIGERRASAQRVAHILHTNMQLPPPHTPVATRSTGGLQQRRKLA
jgi:hypothetical protein